MSKKPNAAQQILARLGVAIGESEQKQAHGSKNASATKAGPGRYHEGGYSKASPIASKGAGRGFALHTASSDKQQRKTLIAKQGRRQYLRQIKHYRRDLADYAAQHRPEWAEGV